MLVLKVTLEGIATSFRYPHFVLGKQPTYDMPPPATIYGHVCSALGEWFDPIGVQFAYHFTFQRKFVDLEHLHIVKASSGKLKGAGVPKVQEGTVQPTGREVLFQPRLVLYLSRPDWETAFRSPRYAVALGRSQDLCCYTDVAQVELQARPAAYLEHTLLPFDFALKPPSSVVLLMPRMLDVRGKRAPTFARYLMLRARVFTDAPDVLTFGQAPESFLVDPSAPEVNGRGLGLVFHAFV